MNDKTILPVEPSAEVAWLLGTITNSQKKDDLRRMSTGKDREDGRREDTHSSPIDKEE